MKILIKFLLVLLVTKTTVSLPNFTKNFENFDGSGSGSGDENTDQENSNENNFDEKLQFYEEFGSGEVSIKSETSSAPSSTSTTIASVSKRNYEVEDLIEKVTTRFNEIRVEFLKNQQDVYDKVEMDFENYKILRDTSVKIINDVYDHETKESNDNLKYIDAQKLYIEKSIENVLGNSWNNEDNLEKLKNLKKRSKLLKNLKFGDCDDCDGFLDKDEIEAELQKNELQKIELEEKIHKYETEFISSSSSDDATRQLNLKYLELIHVYQREIDERKKREKIELMNSMIKDKWRNYAEKVEKLHGKVGIEMEKLTKNFLKIGKLTLNESLYSNDDDWEDLSIRSDPFKWIPFEKYSSIPSDAVIGGEDIDGSKLYIIRTKKDNSYLYGKYAVGYSRKDAYVTNGDVEYGTSSFDILSFKNYVWCDSKDYKIRMTTPPICKTIHNYSTDWSSVKKSVMLPGTLLKNGNCRVGFGWKTYLYANNVEVLGFGSCENSVTDVKFWF